MIYFLALPIDLFPSLFLYFSPTELAFSLHQIETISAFKSLFRSSIFWKTLWKRDISSFIEPFPLIADIYAEYMTLFTGDMHERYRQALNWPPNNTETKDIREIIYYLTDKGYDILLYPILHNIYDCNWVISQAAWNAQLPIINKMIEKGVTYYDYAILCAIESGNIDIFHFLFEKNHAKNTIDFCNKIMSYAARYNYMNIIELMLQKGANAYDWALNSAVCGGNIDVVNLMLELGATDYNNALVNAVVHGNINCIKLMLDKGADDFERTLIHCTDPTIMNLVKSYM